MYYTRLVMNHDRCSRSSHSTVLMSESGFECIEKHKEPIMLCVKEYVPDYDENNRNLLEDVYDFDEKKLEQACGYDDQIALRNHKEKS